MSQKAKNSSCKRPLHMFAMEYLSGGFNIFFYLEKCETEVADLKGSDSRP